MQSRFMNTILQNLKIIVIEHKLEWSKKYLVKEMLFCYNETVNKIIE